MYLHHLRPEHSEYTNCWPKCRADVVLSAPFSVKGNVRNGETVTPNPPIRIPRVSCSFYSSNVIGGAEWWTEVDEVYNAVYG